MDSYKALPWHVHMFPVLQHSLIASLLPGILTPAELRDILLSTTDNIEALNPGYQGLLGSGRLNAYQARLLAQQYIIPTAAFSVSSTLECTGSSICFTDQTLATVTSWIWNFPGGNPSSFTGQIPPPVQYNSPGFYEVSLTVSDGITTDTETKSALVEIRGVITDFSANTNFYHWRWYCSLIFTDLTDCGLIHGSGHSPVEHHLPTPAKPLLLLFTVSVVIMMSP